MASNSFLCHLLFLLVSILASQAHGNAEVRALMEIKAALDPEGRVLGSWTEESNPCHGDYFEGVACNEHGKVANISLQGKKLNGSISPVIAELKCLNGLYLHYNSLHGEIPSEIGELSELADLYLGVNNLSGSIPLEIGDLGSLQVLQLSYNQLTGSIPIQLGLLKNLIVLALQSNQLTGAIPASLGDLKQLTRLDVSSNHLFGSIPSKLSEIPRLTVLDLRNNSLSGGIPSGLTKLHEGFLYGNNRELCGVGFDSLTACPSDEDALKPKKPESTAIRPQQLPQSASLNSTCNVSGCSRASKSSAGAVLVCVVVLLAAAALWASLAYSWHRRRKQKIGSSVDGFEDGHSLDRPKETHRKSASLINLEYSNGWDSSSEGSRHGVVLSPEMSPSLRFNLEEVECATQHFSDVNLLGKRSFAATYKGVLRDGSVAAVKSISKTSCKSEEVHFWKALRMLTMLRHENIVGLRGFCRSRGRGEFFLVYDFMANGSLSRYLDVKDGDTRATILDWAMRVSIIRGIAKGIEYLHSSKPNKPPLVHPNISADKVLIDHYYNPRISDAGIHKLLADDVVFSALKDSAAMGYLAPEYTTTGKFTEKSDVYAFGVIVFQVLTGKSTVSNLRLGAESGKLEDLIDAKLCGKFSRPEAAKLAGIALLCTSDLPSQRPTMSVVLQQLGSNQ